MFKLYFIFVIQIKIIVNPMFHIKYMFMIDNIYFEDRDRFGDQLKAVATHKDTYAGVFTFIVCFYINNIFKKSQVFNTRSYSNLDRIVREYMFNNLI